MKKLSLIISMFILSLMGYSQALESVKVVIPSDSIYQMGTTNGRMMQLIPAPVVGKSIIIQSIDLRNKVIDRLYSPSGGELFYKIGYLKPGYWYDVATINFDQINATGNTVYTQNCSLDSRLFEESMMDSAPIMLKFNQPANFTAGTNELTLYITYRILN